MQSTDILRQAMQRHNIRTLLTLAKVTGASLCEPLERATLECSRPSAGESAARLWVSHRRRRRCSCNSRCTCRSARPSRHDRLTIAHGMIGWTTTDGIWCNDVLSILGIQCRYMMQSVLHFQPPECRVAVPQPNQAPRVPVPLHPPRPVAFLARLST